MSTLTRTLKNLTKVGIKDYFVQMLYIGDTKYGKHIGTDRSGNKYFENNDELPLRTRWVEYSKHDLDAGTKDPGWHAWISYTVDKPPTEDPLIVCGTRKFESSAPRPHYTGTKGAFKTYNTTRAKISAWEPVAAQRA